jgi:cell division protein DivIC|tara:strand:- start:1708 stop:1992 length:285 start_codon:yes stop_codon:yes gene_type:complete
VKNLIILNNRYFLSTAMLIFILLLIDDTTFYKLYKMKQELHSLELENIKKEKEIIQIKEKTKQLTTNKFALEKFAREHYLMKKNDEVIYVFDDL